ncbi:MAG: lipocalin-like domain-containing protein [Thermoplasmata archaeon]|nr:MAG: lipocalin-like domain-containing protein [Thermoplasmata archaeon]
MKTKLSVFLLSLGVCLCAFTTLTQGEEAVDIKAEDNPSLVGTYVYELEGLEGMAIWTETHFIWLLYSKARKPFKDENPTDSELANAFKNLTADGGTYTFTGPSRAKIHRLFSSVPNWVGTEFEFEYEFDGDLLKYWIIQEDGSRGPMGKGRKIK